MEGSFCFIVWKLFPEYLFLTDLIVKFWLLSAVTTNNVFIIIYFFVTYVKLIYIALLMFINNSGKFK